MESILMAVSASAILKLGGRPWTWSNNGACHTRVSIDKVKRFKVGPNDVEQIFKTSSVAMNHIRQHVEFSSDTICCKNQKTGKINSRKSLTLKSSSGGAEKSIERKFADCSKYCKRRRNLSFNRNKATKSKLLSY
uniref:Uncharacterized protein n=1 Tax=Romanomermis culicivorax TaxID=13658 RepID=A0A915IAR7_ROMCU